MPQCKQDIFLVKITDANGENLWDGMFLYRLGYSDIMVAVRGDLRGPSIPLAVALAESLLMQTVPFTVSVPGPGNAINYNLANYGHLTIMAASAYNVDTA